MRMDGVTRYRPEHDVKLLIHGPLLLCFFHIQSAVFTSSSWSTWSATFTSARICVPLSCCLAARTCSRRSFCVMTKELTTSAISAMTSWRDMLPLRGSVVPLKLSVWVNHDTYFQDILDTTLTSARYCMLTVVSFATRPCSKRPWAHDGGLVRASSIGDADQGDCVTGRETWRSIESILTLVTGITTPVVVVLSWMSVNVVLSSGIRTWFQRLLYVWRETHELDSIHAEAQDQCLLRVKEFCMYLYATYTSERICTSMFCVKRHQHIPSDSTIRYDMIYYLLLRWCDMWNVIWYKRWSLSGTRW